MEIWNVPLWHTSSSNFFIGRLGQQGHHRYHHTVRQASLRPFPSNKPHLASPAPGSSPPDPLSPSPLSLPSPGIFPASFRGHKATDEPVTSGFAASALRLKHVKIPIEDPKT
ncbi:hypothetical protein ALT_7565 [Aspergillus lentulus]|uniref:Uncharacterized protein n=1 Tax=Aspergillus lentulus TaxID=293939 RepID=A0AAN4PPS1_ASPLE|nr:hypothetical protein ALT_7565 [Aspergillus lentulus]